jgi:dTDP-4-amino-4,6-dideoxygalactose transaminase
MRIAISQVSIGAEERELVEKVLLSGNLAQGKLVAELEARFADLAQAAHVVATSSGTTALQLGVSVGKAG